MGLFLPSLTRFKAVRPIEVKANNIRLGYEATLIFLLFQASGLNIPDTGFRPDFSKENNYSSSSSIRLEYFKRKLQAGFYNRV